jgi:hypothetical protein
VYVWLITATLALAAGKTADAVAIADEMLATLQKNDFAAGRGEMLVLRGKALLHLNRPEEALDNFREAYAEARRQGARRAEYLALAVLSVAEPEANTAAEYRRLAAEVIRFIESHIEEPELRQGFLNLPDVQRVLAPE